MNDIRLLSPSVLARLLKAVLADDTALNDEEYVLLFNALVNANEPYQGYYEHCIRNVENELDDELDTKCYCATELLIRCSGKRHGKYLQDSIWYALDPQSGTFDWADDPRDLKITRAYDLEYLADTMSHADIARLYKEFEHAGANLTDPLLDYLRKHPELAD